LKGARYGLKDISRKKFALRGSVKKKARQSSRIISTMQEEDISYGAL
jgi:hypothetical protein